MRREGAGPFLDGEGGYTTLAVACALLVSLSLTFALAGAQWSLSRAADVQEVADASALAGANAVAAFSTVVQVVDACALTMGLTGLAVCGAGLVVAAIPVLQGCSPSIIDAGRSILDARRSFARSAARGLSRLEGALPAIIALKARSCASGNSEGSISYAGCAVPFPTASESDWSSLLEDDASSQELGERAEALRQASQLKAEHDARANEAKERAWHADNVDDPSCLQGRAERLAGLAGPFNPRYQSPERWRFGFARSRALNYYATRFEQERPSSDAIEERARSAARKRFFLYAYEEVRDSTCIEEGDACEVRLPELAHDADMVRACHLYTDAVWPCTMEDGAKVLHMGTDCPGAAGPGAGPDALASIEAGSCARCPVCQMDVQAMGRVASASTNIDNGFEYYWQAIVEASRDYQQEKDASCEAERQMRELADEGGDAFERVGRALSLKRPKICPAGAWGCISVVLRGSSAEVPAGLTKAFLSEGALPPGAAISAATLAPDDSSDEANLMRHVLDGVRQRGSGDPVDLVGNVGDLWGGLLVDYGSAFDGAFGHIESFFDRIGSLFGEPVARRLKERVCDVAREAFDAAGLTPSDVRLRKPVLVNSQTVLDKAGMTSAAQARRLIEGLPDDPDDLLGEYVPTVLRELGADKYVVAEIPIPGTELTVPLTIDLARLWEVAA